MTWFYEGLEDDGGEVSDLPVVDEMVAIFKRFLALEKRDYFWHFILILRG